MNILAQENPVIPNATFIAELVAFAIILFIIWRWIVPPIQRSMEQRQQAIREQFAEGERAKERLAAAEAEYEQALAEARREASRLREEAQEQRKQIVEEASSEARERANDILARAEEQITNERQQAMRQLRDEVGRLAVQLSERVVGESLADDARQQRVVERFLDELERAPEPSGAGTAAGEGPETVR